MLAWQGLKMMGIREGQEILINGAGGGVGSQLIQMIPEGIVVSGVDHTSKMEQMKSWGYHLVFDYTKVNFTRTGKHYDAILDVKTLQGPWDYARALKSGGKYVTVGGTIPRLLRLITAAPLVQLVRNRKLRILSLKPNKDMIEVNRLFNRGSLEPIIDGPYPMDKIPELIQYFAHGKHTGKVIVKISDT
jgi:NADPH:quinone reductase-like Zn-dependent oxidoreductase